jgi:hypothetical protein
LYSGCRIHFTVSFRLPLVHWPEGPRAVHRYVGTVHTGVRYLLPRYADEQGTEMMSGDLVILAFAAGVFSLLILGLILMTEYEEPPR